MANPQFTDAIALLKADHRKVEDLFEQFEKAGSPARKKTLARQICLELKIHTLIEEEIFYPAFRGRIEDDTLDEAYVEHDGAKLLRSEEHTSELQSLMRISYAVFCLKKKNKNTPIHTYTTHPH